MEKRISTGIGGHTVLALVIPRTSSGSVSKGQEVS